MRKRKWRKILLGVVIGTLLMAQMVVPVLADEAGIFVDGSWLTENS